MVIRLQITLVGLILNTMCLVHFEFTVVTANNNESTGMRFSVSIENIVNGSHVEIGVQQTNSDVRDDDRHQQYYRCPSGSYLVSYKNRDKVTKGRRRRPTGRHIKGKSSLKSELRRQNICRPCSQCPESLEVVETCSLRQDTQCGICTGSAQNRTCATIISVGVIQENESFVSYDESISLSPTTIISDLSETKNGKSQSHKRLDKAPSHVTTSKDLNAKSEGDSPDYIGALVTAALSLVMFLILMVTAPLVIYLKVRDWCRYGRSPEDSESGNFRCCCFLFKNCHKDPQPVHHHAFNNQCTTSRNQNNNHNKIVRIDQKNEKDSKARVAETQQCEDHVEVAADLLSNQNNDMDSKDSNALPIEDRLDVVMIVDERSDKPPTESSELLSRKVEISVNLTEELETAKTLLESNSTVV